MRASVSRHHRPPHIGARESGHHHPPPTVPPGVARPPRATVRSPATATPQSPGSARLFLSPVPFLLTLRKPRRQSTGPGVEDLLPAPFLLPTVAWAARDTQCQGCDGHCQGRAGQAAPSTRPPPPFLPHQSDRPWVEQWVRPDCDTRVPKLLSPKSHLEEPTLFYSPIMV